MAGSRIGLVQGQGQRAASPLQRLGIVGAQGRWVAVCDGAGREYFRQPAAPEVWFIVGGALGMHTAQVFDVEGRVIDRLSFQVDAQTAIEDEGGKFAELLAILNRTMRCYGPDGVSPIQWRGRAYRCFVPWILDHSHTAKGMQYLSPSTAEAADLFGGSQRPDGMIYSFVNKEEDGTFHESAYGPFGYAKRDGGVLFGRQPVENHNEANFVDTVYLAWKGGGDDRWMAGQLGAAMRALDYSASDRARWSSKFSLLKRGYTIDSWDFQPDDQYLVRFRLASAQMIDPEKTRFGVFFGDNTAYAHACDQLAEMLDHAGRGADAGKYRQRGADIRRRLSEVAWNGRFYTHRVEEDPAVQRDFGVDEKSQIAMSNAYALNRGTPHEQCVAILRTYEELRQHLPAGSPGEWYAIYPPFERGFAHDNKKWQYMNGGVHGHAAGELARGAFEHGFERYGADILRRVGELGRQHGGVVRFAYTGAVEPPPPAPAFRPISLAAVANMDLWDKGGEGAVNWVAADAGNDLRNLPTGRQTFAGIPFEVQDPAGNGRRSAVGVSCRARFPRSVEVAIGQSAGAVYLLHTVSGIGPSKIAGAMTFQYEDGGSHTVYLFADKHLTGWWFPKLKGDYAGVAWRGPNTHSTDVGICWAAIPNRHPEKVIRSLMFSAAMEDAIYALAGLTLADRVPYVASGAASFGGPDNWAGGTCMAALIQGLAGVADAPGATAFRHVRLSPRWAAAEVNDAAITVRYPASKGYVAYRWRHDPVAHCIELLVTSGGERVELRVLLPETAAKAVATIDERPAAAQVQAIEGSRYAVVAIASAGPARVRIEYGA